jgi:hypothetical protein
MVTVQFMTEALIINFMQMTQINVLNNFTKTGTGSEILRLGCQNLAHLEIKR